MMERIFPQMHPPNPMALEPDWGLVFAREGAPKRKKSPRFPEKPLAFRKPTGIKRIALLPQIF